MQHAFGMDFGLGKRDYPYSTIQGIYICWTDSTEKHKMQLMKQQTKGLSAAIFMTSSVGSGGFPQRSCCPRVHMDVDKL